MFRTARWIPLCCLSAIAALAAVTAAPPNLSKALEAQRQVVAERPDDAGAHNDLGNLLQLATLPSEAEEAYRKAIALDPKKASALFNLGVLLQQRGDLREAQKLYRQAVAADPRHAWAHYQLGTVYEQRGDEKNAVRSYAKAFVLDPQLTFSEVNPHLVDNRLLMRAVLVAYRSEDARPHAPPVYEEAGRIRSDLLGPLPGSEKPAETAEPQPNGEPAAPTAVTGSPPPPPTQGQTTAEPPTVLRPGDLDRSKRTGQAAPTGRFPSQPRAVPQQQANPGLRQWSRPEPTFEGGSAETLPEEGGESQFAPPQVVTPPPAGVFYRPGIQSTGRLHLEVGPARGKRAERG